MPLRVIYDVATGAKLRQSAVADIEPASISEGLVILPLDTEPPDGVARWSPSALAYEGIGGAINRVRLTRREFLARLDAAGALDKANARIVTPPTTPQEIGLVAGLVKFKDYITSSDFVDITHPKAVLGVGQLVALGYITSAQAAVILQPSTVAVE